MNPLDALWHLLNFVFPAFGVALLASAAAKLLWRTELAGVRWRRLFFHAAAAGCAALVGGVIVFGRDGRIASYAALVLASALALWWTGFAARR